MPADHTVELPARHGHAKIAPAVAAGCTAVVKPSELTPLTMYALADLLHEPGCLPECLRTALGTPGPG